MGCLHLWHWVGKLKRYQIRFLIGAHVALLFGESSCFLTLTQRRSLPPAAPDLCVSFYVVAPVSSSLVEGDSVAIHYRTATAYIGESSLSKMAHFPVHVHVQAQAPSSDTETATESRLDCCPTADRECMAKE